MFEKRKSKMIKEYIKRHSWEFSNFDYNELEIFLNKIDDINSIIKKANKMDGMSEHYLMLTIINYKRFKFNEEQVGLILSHKIDLLKKFTLRNCPNLDHIYYALSPNENLYKLFVTEYMDGYDSSKFQQLKDYTKVLSKHYKEIHGLLDKLNSTVVLRKQLTYLTPDKMITLLNNDKFRKLDKENKKRVFNLLTKKDDNFKNAINLSDKAMFKEAIDLIILDASKKKNNTCDFIEKMAKTEDDCYSLENVKQYDSEVTDIFLNEFCSFQSDDMAKMYIQFLKDDFFKNSSIERQKTLLNLFKLEVINRSLTDQMEISIPDSKTLSENVAANGCVEFINPDTHMKIFVKSKTNEKNNQKN